jgi:hypothetical protein
MRSFSDLFTYPSRYYFYTIYNDAGGHLHSVTDDRCIAAKKAVENSVEISIDAKTKKKKKYGGSLIKEIASLQFSNDTLTYQAVIRFDVYTKAPAVNTPVSIGIIEKGMASSLDAMACATLASRPVKA